jgi:hypothetical protein
MASEAWPPELDEADLPPLWHAANTRVTSSERPNRGRDERMSVAVSREWDAADAEPRLGECIPLASVSPRIELGPDSGYH